MELSNTFSKCDDWLWTCRVLDRGLAAYYVAPFCACNEMDFMKKLVFCPDILGEKMSRILVQGHLIGRY